MSVEAPERVIAGLPVLKVNEPYLWLKLLVYADTGVGKTTLVGSAATVESMCPILLIDLEGGTTPLRRKYPDIDVIRVKNLFDKSGRAKHTAWEYLFDVYESLKLENPYRTLIVDSGTEASMVCMQHVILKQIAEDPSKLPNPEVAGQKEYQIIAQKMRKFIRIMRDLECHFLMTALVDRRETESGLTTAIVPKFAGKKLSYEVPTFMGNVMYMEVEEVTDKETKEKHTVRKLLNQPYGKYMAKDRTDKLPRIMYNPTMEAISKLALDEKET